jgi:hypothetical protein
MKLVADSKGHLHATWTQFGTDGNGKGVYYSQSKDLGRTWSKPVQVAAWQPGWYEVDWLSAGAVGDEIHLVWEGSSNVAALYDRVSTDGGLTWSEPRQILSDLVGENGFADIVVDSANQLHLFVVKRGDAGAITNGVWYTVWDTDHWRDPILLGISNSSLYSQLGQLSASALQSVARGALTGNGLRYQRAAIVNGNELFLVVVNEWDGDIWSSHTRLAAPYIRPQPFPEPAATPTPVPESPSIPTPTSTPVRLTNRIMENQDTNVGDPILVASLPVLLLAIGTVICVWIFRRTRS